MSPKLSVLRAFLGILVHMKNARNPAAQLGIVIALAMSGFTLLGVWLDKRYGTGFIFTLAGLALAVVFVGYELWKLTKLIDKDETQNDDDQDANEK